MAFTETRIRTYNLCLLGYGNVNRTLVRLLQKKEPELRERGIAWKVTGVATRRLGWIADPDGVLKRDGSLTDRRVGAPVLDNVRVWLRAAGAHVLLEASSLNPHTGEPARDYLRAALEMGAHAITANKGPVVHGYGELSSLAASKGKRFLFESAVMDGAPIFSLFRENLPAIEVRGFRGILNSTTNVILGGMEEGLNFEESLKRAQEAGVAETDPSHDIEGWDAAVKVAALIIVIMKAPISLDAIQREGIGGLTGDMVRAARAAEKPYKLVCRARRIGQEVTASVRPEQLPLSDPLAWVSGTTSAVNFETDMIPGLGITETDGGVEATAYGMLADFVRAVAE